MFIESYVSWAKKTTDAPEEYLVAGALACLSAAVGRKVCLNNRIYANLWLVLLGDSSVARKSTAVSLARMLCEEAGVHTFPDRITPESFYETLSVNPQGLFALGELGGWLGSLARSYALGLKQDMAELYDCPRLFKRIRKDAKGRVKEYCAANPYISMLSASTPEWLEVHISENDAGGGFLPRFCYVFGKPRTPFPVPPELVVPSTLVEILREISRCSGQIVLEEGTAAYDTYAEWFYSFRDQLKDCVRDLVPFAVRLETVALKTALLIQAERHPGEPLLSLHPDAVRKGCAYAEVFFKNAEAIVRRLSYSSFERLCQRVIGQIERKPGCTARDILRIVCVPRAAFQDVIDYLIESGKVIPERPKGKRGRPTVRFFLS